MRRSARYSSRPGHGARRGCCGWPTRRRRRGGSSSTTARSRRSSSAASRCCTGITAVEGRFVDGDPIDVCAADGRPVARGLVNYSSDELPGLLGRSTKDLARELGPQYEREVIHRDDLVIL